MNNLFRQQYPSGKTDHDAAAAYGKRGWGRYKSRKDWEASLYGCKLELPKPPEPNTNAKPSDYPPGRLPGDPTDAAT